MGTETLTAQAQLSAAQAQLVAQGGLSLPLGPLTPMVAGAITAMSKREWIVTGPIERVGAVLRGCPLTRLADPATGARPYKVAPCSQAPGARALHAVGLALGSGAPVLCLLGLASAASGSFYEALNTAVLAGARVVFVVGVRDLQGAPVGRQIASGPAVVAASLGMATYTVSSDEEAVHQAVASARTAQGPQLIEVKL